MKPSREELQKLYWQDDLSLEEIGKRFRVTGGSILYWMKNYGIPRKQSIWKLNKLAKKRRIPIPKRKYLYNLYWEKCLSTITIAKKFGVSQQLVYKWMKKLNLSTRKPHDWHYVDVDLSATLTLAYVLGVLVGDGNLNKHEVRLRALDKPFVESFHKALIELGFRPRKFTVDPDAEHPHMLYGVSGASKKFADWFRKLGMGGLRRFILQDKERTISFLRGFYESEGFSNRVGVCNTNKKLIEVVKEAIEKLGFTCYLCGPYKRKSGNPCWKPIYMLLISRTQGKDFIKLIKPVIKDNSLGD